jgi:hypothetical protein
VNNFNSKKYAIIDKNFVISAAAPCLPAGRDRRVRLAKIIKTFIHGLSAAGGSAYRVKRDIQHGGH